MTEAEKKALIALDAMNFDHKISYLMSGLEAYPKGMGAARFAEPYVKSGEYQIDEDEVKHISSFLFGVANDIKLDNSYRLFEIKDVLQKVAKHLKPIPENDEFKASLVQAIGIIDQHVSLEEQIYNRHEKRMDDFDSGKFEDELRYIDENFGDGNLDIDGEELRDALSLIRQLDAKRLRDENANKKDKPEQKGISPDDIKKQREKPDSNEHER